MKIYLFLNIPPLLLLSFLLHSCSAGSADKKTEGDSSVKYDPVLPYKPVEKLANVNHPGYGIYMKTCFQCHQQPEPSILSEQKWTMTIPRMVEHAGISEQEGKKVLEYLLSIRAEEVR